MSWENLDRELAAAPGTISAYVARLGSAPAYARHADTTHYAASTMKTAVLAAAYRAGDAGLLDLDAPVPVHNDFASARAEAARFSNARNYDNDSEVWQRIGGSAPLRWLARRMIVTSSNLATNLVISQVGLASIAEVWSLVGARHSVTGRGIEDFPARDAGIDNVVTAADLARLLGSIALGAQQAGPLAAPDTCSAMLEVLFAQQRREDLAAGLPPGTRIAHKNGWVQGVRHGSGVVFPDDAPPYVIAVCTTTDLADGGSAGEGSDDAACRLIARISAQAWAARHRLDT